MDDLSDYERKRLETIASNQKVLEELGLAPLAAPLATPLVKKTSVEDTDRRRGPSIVWTSTDRRDSLRTRVPLHEAAVSQVSVRRSRVETRAHAVARVAGCVWQPPLPRSGLRARKVKEPLRGESRVEEPANEQHGDAVPGDSPRLEKRGGAGGWNAGPYVGTAFVQASRRTGIGARIAIRKRSDGSERLYGYFGRTQIAFKNGTLDKLPCEVSGVMVLSYTPGGTLDDQVDDEYE